MWISELKLLLKHLLDTNANERFYSHLFLLHTIVPVLQPNSRLTNKTVSQVNSTNTTDNTDNGWCDHKSVSRSHVTKKIQSCFTEPIEHSQQYRYRTVIDLSLNINHFIRSALQHGSDMLQIFSNQERTIQWRKGNLKNESDTRCRSNNQKWFDHGFNNSIQMSKCPVHIKLILLLTKIIKDVWSYSKGDMCKKHL